MNDERLTLEDRVAAIKQVKEKVEDQLLRIPGVNAVGIGPKFKDGQPTGEWAITVLLTQKKPRAEIPPAELVPDEIEGIKTDVEECGPITIIADDPINGGTNLESGGGGRPGTLGCVLLTVGAQAPRYALTNQHVLMHKTETTVTPPGEEAGPRVCSICSSCCSNLIGRVAAARLTLFADAGLVRLDTGTKYLAEVADVGTIRGEHTVTAGELQDANGKFIYSVSKNGRTTGVTTGTIRNLNVTGPSRLADGTVHRQMKDQIRIVPDDSRFAGDGDSGAVILNANREVVGLLFGAVTNEMHPSFGEGFACPIQMVIDSFKPEFNLKVDTATTPGDVRTVPASAMAADTLTADLLAAPAQPVTDAAHESLLRAQEEVLQTAAGRRYAEIILQHQQEVRTLIDTNRRVALVWHRDGGPTIVQQMIQAVRFRDLPLAAAINGRPLAECVEKILAVFSKYGSQPLRADIDVIKPLLERLGGLSYTQWLAQLE